MNKDQLLNSLLEDLRNKSDIELINELEKNKVSYSLIPPNENCIEKVTGFFPNKIIFNRTITNTNIGTIDMEDVKDEFLEYCCINSGKYNNKKGIELEVDDSSFTVNKKDTEAA